ncbi:MAG: potassium-transporting ATPase subunit KdpC [Coriobacteriales bacterium]|nr:potassium-transporting ATPase subunit KdpC [Coriobacteriales bacterium]
MVSIRMAFVTLLVTGVVYPLVVTGIAAVAFPRQAAGSLIERDGKIVGSTLIGQAFSSDRYFHPRPSAADYDGTASGPSNLGPTSKRLAGDVSTRVDEVVEANPGASKSAVPVDLVTASASGLDPHVSPASAKLQVARVASARGLTAEQVLGLVEEHTEGRQLGLLGEPRVNVLELNIALDEFGK